MLRDRSHDTGKLLQDGSLYSARLRSSGAHPPPAPPPASSPAPPTHFLSSQPRVPSEKQLPAVQGARGQAEEGAGPGRDGPGPGSPAGRAGLAEPWPRPSSPLGRPGTASRLLLELCSFSSNYLSEQRVGEGPEKEPPLPEGLPISIRGALLSERRGNILVSLPTSSFLFCCLYSWIRHSLLFSPLPLGSLKCGRATNTVSCPPANSGPEWSSPRGAGCSAELVAASVSRPRTSAKPGFVTGLHGTTASPLDAGSWGSSEIRISFGLLLAQPLLLLPSAVISKH